MTIGIPRALYAYKHPTLWHALAHGLGRPHLVSPRTNADILARGLRLSDGEACLSYKVFMGHCAWLRERGVHALLVPRYKSLKRGQHCCPKFFGLPDVVRVLFPDVEVVDPTVSARRPLTAALVGSGIRLGAGVRSAFRAACQAQLLARRARRRQAVNCAAAIRRRTSVALVAHPYTLHDPFVNMAVAQRLQQLDVTPIPVDSIDGGNHAPAPDFGWDFARELFAQVHALISAGVHGVIQLSTCNCGCDAVIGEYVHTMCRHAHVPYMGLIIDEHSADGALQTRLEAFVDTLTAREVRRAACA
jgi:predicted nucleotide-binding protein (sugar kinase/HSP70/actin superfamily)